ncbi:MAG: hypothetical protein JNM57_07255 [Cyclobacteriaceae bacterium]|nr:hypothetical protein [Cyclobacteriaceae bacterium]
MNWITLYIRGKADFRDDVKRKLENSDLYFMPGSVDGSADNKRHALYWLDDRTAVRDLKKAIGAKLIWKYRLTFYTSLESFIAAQEKAKNHADFTNEELSMITSMKTIVRDQTTERNSRHHIRKNKVAA